MVPIDTPQYFKDILFTINYFKSSSGQASLFFKRLHFRRKVQRKALPSSLAASSLRAPCLPSKVTLGHPGSLLCCTGPRRAANPSPSKAPAGSTCLGFARGSSLFLDLIWQLPPPSDPTGRCCRWCEPRAPNLCRGPSGSDGSRSPPPTPSPPTSARGVVARLPSAGSQGLVPRTDVRGVCDNAQPALNVTNSEKKTLVPPSLAICLYLRHCGGFFQNRRMTRSKFFRGHVHLDAPHPHGGPSSAPVYLLSLSRVYLLLFKEMVAKDQKHFMFTCEAHWSARSAGPRASVRTLSSVPEFCCKLSGVWGHEYSSTTPAPGRMPSLGLAPRRRHGRVIGGPHRSP